MKPYEIAKLLKRVEDFIRETPASDVKFTLLVDLQNALKDIEGRKA